MINFLEKNKHDSRISSTYYVMGTVLKRNEQLDAKKKSIICKIENLEATKSLFVEVDTCAIFSVQAKPIQVFLIEFNDQFNPFKHRLLQDFMVLLNMNWKDEKLYLNPTKSQTLIKNSTAIKCYNRWKLLEKSVEYRLDQASKRV